MGKGSGGTRASSSSSPRGFSAPLEGAASRLVAQYNIAERLYANGELEVDPGDAVYEDVANLMSTGNGRISIEESIEGTTDYIAQVTERESIVIQSKYTSESDAIRDYGTERVEIPMGSRSLMDIIEELRLNNEAFIFNKYR